MITEVKKGTAKKEDLKYISQEVAKIDGKVSIDSEKLIVFENILHAVETKCALNQQDLVEMHKTIGDIDLKLQDCINQKTNEIKGLLKEKAGKEDLKYVNEQLAEIDQTTVTQGETLKMLDHLYTRVLERVELQECKFEEFQDYVTSKKDEIMRITNEYINTQGNEEAGENALSKLIAKLEGHESLMSNLNDKINNIQHDYIDPKFVEFMNNYKDHSSTINILVETVQELKGRGEMHGKMISIIRKKMQTLNNQQPAQEEEKKEEESKEVYYVASNNMSAQAVTSIIYDNELLNHPEMFNKLSDVYGVNKVIDLSGNIESSLLQEALEHNDAELLMGALVSVDSDLM